MSVMVVSEKTYQELASSISYYISSKKVHVYPLNMERTKDIEEVIVKEVEQLRIQNYKSYGERYKEDADVTPLKYHDTLPMSLMQTYKSLQCVLYNIETKYHSIILDKFMKSLTTRLIQDTTAYDLAVWG